MITALDHVQLAMPTGREAEARGFYIGVLGMTEMEKPPTLAKRGGAWFVSGNAQVHLGVEQDFHAAKKAHPALCISQSSALREKLANAGYPTIDDHAIPGTKRFYTEDCFGNRIELICQD